MSLFMKLINNNILNVTSACGFMDIAHSYSVPFPKGIL
jgi:hypothetical protein